MLVGRACHILVEQIAFLLPDGFVALEDSFQFICAIRHLKKAVNVFGSHLSVKCGFFIGLFVLRNFLRQHCIDCEIASLSLLRAGLSNFVEINWWFVAERSWWFGCNKQRSWIGLDWDAVGDWLGGFVSLGVFWPWVVLISQCAAALIRLTCECQLVGDLMRFLVHVITIESLQPIYVKLRAKNACWESLLQLSAFLGIHLEAVKYLCIA